MNRLNKFCLISVLTLGGIVGGDLALSGIRDHNYPNEIAKIEKIKDSREREQALLKYEQQINDTRPMAYVVIGAVGGLLGLLTGLINTSQGTSSGYPQPSSSTDDSSDDSSRTAGEHYMGVG